MGAFFMGGGGEVEGLGDLRIGRGKRSDSGSLEGFQCRIDFFDKLIHYTFLKGGRQD